MARLTGEAKERARLAKMPPSYCVQVLGGCGQQVDLFEVNQAIRRKEYPIRHHCGRVLYQGP